LAGGEIDNFLRETILKAEMRADQAERRAEAAEKRAENAEKKTDTLGSVFMWPLY
jgi:hypothetical protein